MVMIELNLFLNENRDVFFDFILEDMGELFGVLDFNNEKIVIFYIYEFYFVILKEICR